MLVVALGILAFSAFAHEKKSHEQKTIAVPKQSKINDEYLKAINENYTARVKPIFQKSCFDCHSQNPRLPWYFHVPLARGLMESDMKEAKEHLDMTKGFPFTGHGSPLEDLVAIRDSIKDKSMPPLRYRIMHRGSGLTEKEEATVFDWLDESERLLSEKKQ